MTKKPKRGGRREPPGGRPTKGNVVLHCYVKPETVKKIKEVQQSDETLGEVIDRIVQEVVTKNTVRGSGHSRLGGE